MIREIKVSGDHIIKIDFALKAVAELCQRYPELNWRKYTPVADTNLARTIEYYTLCINLANKGGELMTIESLFDLIENNEGLLERIEGAYWESRGIPAGPMQAYMKELEDLVNEFNHQIMSGVGKETISDQFEKDLAAIQDKYKPSLGRLGEAMGKAQM